MVSNSVTWLSHQDGRLGEPDYLAHERELVGDLNGLSVPEPGNLQSKVQLSGLQLKKWWVPLPSSVHGNASVHVTSDEHLAYLREQSDR